MHWDTSFHPEFKAEVGNLSPAVRIELLSALKALAEFGPSLGRPRVDTLKGSSFANMKELRFQAEGGIWRIAFAFDPIRTAIILVAGNKSGVGQREFYRRLIDKADQRYKSHLSSLKSKE